MDQILIVEDETVIRGALARLLKHHDYAVSEAGSVTEAQQFNLEDFDLIISDLRMPGAPGTDLIPLAGDVPVLMMTSYASMQSAVDTMKCGAVDYIAKPFDHDEMLESVAQIIANHAPKTLDNKQRRRKKSKRGEPQFGGMIGSCAPMMTLYEHITKVAPTDSTVLINGETGTGKEMVARAIHQHSKRAKQAIICVNCAAIPETLIESELFGYEKGAFTGANTDRQGLIEAANGGTLFLDEIGELPLEAQARLLRFIQEGEVRRIGSTKTETVDVRLICATHRNLKVAAAQNLFRPDLYYRLNVIPLNLPPLRERGKDILELAETFMERNCSKHGKELKRLSPKAIQAVTTYAWPGNVRELENIIERVVILADDTEIENDLLNLDMELINLNQLRSSKSSKKASMDDMLSYNGHAESLPQQGSANNEELSLEDYFQRFVLEHQDSMSETELAKKLGVSRKCLWERRQRLGIPRKKSK